jgi:cytochrome o ubiquinol oxidase subunit 1
MTLLKMPLFTWTSLCSMVLVVTVFPILTVAVALLSLDRLLGMHFFTTDLGGNPMLYTNLIWMWGHPEVYILILPAFGIYSEVVSTFSRKSLFSYSTAVFAAVGISALATLVWLHHFFTMGSDASVNAFFGIMTMIIAIPTAAQLFNWLATMYKGRIHFATPMLWFMGFLVTFTFGGVAGVLLAVPPLNYQVHNSLFLVAHFHTMAIGGALFGLFAGVSYWFPKITGFKLNETLGKYSFWAWIIGFYLSFVPLYILGFMGATRRLDSYDPSTGWQPLFMVSALGIAIIALGVGLQLLQIFISFKNRKQNLDTTGDPWDGRTLEWSTSSPPPAYNFAVIPQVNTQDAFLEMKKTNYQNVGFEEFHAPRNTAMGIYVSAFIFLIGFAFVWHIVWLGVVGLIGAVACVVIRTMDENTEKLVSKADLSDNDLRKFENV